MDTKSQAMAELLLEAAAVLNEAQARDDRKKVTSDVKSTKKDDKVADFLHGKLEKDEAEKIYKETKNAISKMRDQISKIPEETTGEKFASFFRMDFEGAYYLKETIAGLIIGAVGGAINLVGTQLTSIGAVLSLNYATSTGMSIASWLTKIKLFKQARTTHDGEKNWNKAYAERVVDKLERRLNKAYSQYYTDLQECAQFILENDCEA